MVDQDVLRVFVDDAGEVRLGAVRHLAAGPDVDPADVIDRDSAVLRLEVSLMLALRVIRALNDAVRLGEPSLEVAAVAGARGVDVGRRLQRQQASEGSGSWRLGNAGVGVEVGVNNRRVGLHRFVEVEDGRHLFVLDVDEVDRSLRGVLVDRRHRCDALTGEPDAVAGQDRHVLEVAAVEPVADVSPGDHGEDTRQRLGRRRVDADDAGVGVRAVEQLAPQHIIERQVGRIDRQAGDLLDAVDPGDGLSENLVRHKPPPSGAVKPILILRCPQRGVKETTSSARIG